MKTTHHTMRGVTMIEMIVVIVITGIIGAVIALFIRVPVKGYTDSVARAAATDVADATLRRLARDLRLALPNSVRLPEVQPADTRHIEFLQTTAGLRYLAEDDVVGATPPVNYLSWNDADKKTFDVVGGLPTGRHRPSVNNYVVVYNLGEDQEPGNAYNCDVACNRALITGLTGDTIELQNNPFAAQAAAGAALMSPSKRFHVVTSAVTYACDLASGKLTRYWDYPITAAQGTPPVGAKSALVAQNIKGCQFQYDTLASKRSGLVGVTLELGIAGDEQARLILEHQVHVDNTP